MITPDTDIVRKAKMIPQAPIEAGHPLYRNNSSLIIHTFQILCKESVNFMHKSIAETGIIEYDRESYGTKYFYTKNS